MAADVNEFRKLGRGCGLGLNGALCCSSAEVLHGR